MLKAELWTTGHSKANLMTRNTQRTEHFNRGHIIVLLYIAVAAANDQTLDSEF